MPTDAHVGRYASGDRHAPAQEQLPVRITEAGTRLDCEGTHRWIVIEIRHERHIDHAPYRRVRDKALKAVPAASHRKMALLPHRVVHGGDDLVGRADEAHVIGRASESLAAPAGKV